MPQTYKNMSSYEFVSRVCDGERNLRGIRLIESEVLKTEVIAFNDYMRDCNNSRECKGAIGRRKGDLEVNPLDLSDSDLSALHAVELYLPFTIAVGTRFSGARIPKANLYHATLRKADLSNSNLYRADLGLSILSGADCSCANMRKVNLKTARLDGAKFRGTDNRGSNMFGVHVTGADFEGANLTGATITNGAQKIKNLRMEGAILNETTVDETIMKALKEKLPGMVVRRSGRYFIVSYFDECF